MKRVARLAAPSAAGVLLRASQLMVLVAMTAVAAPSMTAPLVASFGIVSAFAVMTDSGAANFLLAASNDEVNASTLRRTLTLHLAIGLAGTAAAVAYSGLRFSLTSPLLVGVVVSLGLMQVIDSLVRVARVPLLRGGADHQFAAFDLGLAFSRIVWVGMAWGMHDLAWLLALPSTSMVILAIALKGAMRQVGDGIAPAHLSRRILTFGANGAASALYSQAPLLIAGAFFPVHTTAQLALAYRVTQPWELVPATLSQQLVPRVRIGRIPVRKAWAVFVALGAVLGGMTVVARPLIEWVFTFELEQWAILALIALALPLKFGNYALAAFMFARGMVVEKLKVTCVVGLFVAAVTLVMASTGGAAAVASMSLMAEALLLIGMTRYLRTPRSAV